MSKVFQSVQTAADLLQHLIDVLNVMKHTVIMMAVIMTDIRSSMSVNPRRVMASSSTA